KYIAFSSDIYGLENLRRRGTTINGEEVAEQINRITKRVMQAERDLTEDETLTFKDVQRLQEVLHSLKLRLQSVYDFYHGYDPMFTWWMPQPYQQLSEYMNRYAAAL